MTPAPPPKAGVSFPSENSSRGGVKQLSLPGDSQLPSESPSVLRSLFLWASLPFLDVSVPSLGLCLLSPGVCLPLSLGVCPLSFSPSPFICHYSLSPGRPFCSQTISLSVSKS